VRHRLPAGNRAGSAASRRSLDRRLDAAGRKPGHFSQMLAGAAAGAGLWALLGTAIGVLLVGYAVVAAGACVLASERRDLGSP